MFYNNVHENALNRYFKVSAFRKILVLLCLESPVIDFFGFEHQKVGGKGTF